MSVEQNEGYPKWPETEIKSTVIENPVLKLADQIIRQGRDELASYDRGAKSPMSAVNVLEPEGRNVGKRVNTTRSRAMIFFGNTLKALHETIISGEYNPYYFAESVNVTLGNTAETKIPVLHSDRAPIKIPENEIKIMRQAVESDQSMGLLIEDDRLMPKRLKEQLTGAGILTIMKGILPSYRKAFGNSPSFPMSEGDRQKQADRLVQIDDYLEKLGAFVAEKKPKMKKPVAWSDSEIQKLLRLKKNHESGKIRS